MEETRHIGKQNKLPYFLWLNKPVYFKQEKDHIIVEDESTGTITQSDMTRVPKFEIFLMKQFPVMLFFYFTMFIPAFLPLVLGLLVSFFGALIIRYFPKWFKKFVLLMCIGGLYLAINDLEILVEHSLYVIVELTLIFFFVREMYCLIYEDEYYYLDDFASNFKLSGTRATPGKGTFSFWKFNIPYFGLQTKKKRVTWANLSLTGYYVRVKKWEINNEKA